MSSQLQLSSRAPRSLDLLFLKSQVTRTQSQEPLIPRGKANQHSSLPCPLAACFALYLNQGGLLNLYPTPRVQQSRLKIKYLGNMFLKNKKQKKNNNKKQTNKKTCKVLVLNCDFLFLSLICLNKSDFHGTSISHRINTLSEPPPEAAVSSPSPTQGGSLDFSLVSDQEADVESNVEEPSTLAIQPR